MKYLQLISAILLLLSGVILCYIGFFVPPVGEISNSVLWYFGQTLIYAGSCFGLKAYVDHRLANGKDPEREFPSKHPPL